MKRDMDLVRQILLAVEGSSDLIVLSFTVDTDPQTKQFHLRLLQDAGHLSYEKSPAGGMYGWRMTWTGHEFLDEVRDPEIWRKTKEGADKVGSWSIKLLGEIASGLIRAKAIELGLPLA